MMNICVIGAVLEMPPLKSSMTHRQRIDESNRIDVDISIARCGFNLGMTTAEGYYNELVKGLGLVVQMLPEFRGVKLDILRTILKLAVFVEEPDEVLDEIKKFMDDLK